MEIWKLLANHDNIIARVSSTMETFQLRLISFRYDIRERRFRLLKGNPPLEVCANSERCININKY